MNVYWNYYYYWAFYSIGFCFFVIWRNIFLCPIRVLLFYLFHVVWKISVITMFTIFEIFIWHLEIIGHDVVLQYSKLHGFTLSFPPKHPPGHPSQRWSHINLYMTSFAETTSFWKLQRCVYFIYVNIMG